MAQIDFFKSLKNKDFRLFWLTQIFAVTGSFMQMAAQGWLVIKLTNSPFYLGLTVMAGSLPVLFFSLFAGVLADRFSKRNILIITQIVSMVLGLAMALLIFTGKIHIWHVIALATLLGIDSAFDIPTRQAFVIELAGKEDVLNVISINTSLVNIARTIAPVLAAFVIDKIGMAACFLVNGLSFLPVIIALFFIRNIPVNDNKPQASFIMDLKEGLVYIKDNKEIFYVFILLALSSIFIFPCNVLMPDFAHNVLHLDVRGFGLLMMASGLGALLSNIILAGLGNYPKKGLILKIACLSLSFLLVTFALSRSFVSAYIFLLVLNFALAVQVVISNTSIQEKVPDHLRGRVMSIYVITFLGIFPLGSFIIGSMASVIGISLSLVISAIVHLIIAGFINYKAIGENRKERKCDYTK